MVYQVTKKPLLGALFTILFGPLGFLYYSWKKAVVAFLLFTIPNLSLYGLGSLIAEITRWTIQILMAIFAYLDLKDQLYLFEDAVVKIINVISVPIILLNYFSGIVGGIWLLILGQWRLVFASIAVSFVVPLAYSLVTIIQMPLVLLMSYAEERNKKTLAIFSGFINLFIGHAVIFFYVFGVLEAVIKISIKTHLSIIPFLVLGYSVATGPFSFMASRESEDSVGSFIGVFVTQISYLVFSIAFLLNIPSISLPIIFLIVFGLEIYQMNLASKMLTDSIESRTTDTYRGHEYPGLLSVDIKALLNEGLNLYRNQEFEAALLKFDEAILFDDSNKNAYYGRALANNKLRNKQNAISDLKCAAQLGHLKAQEFLTGKNIEY